MDNYKVIQIDESSWCIEEIMVNAFLFEGSERSLLVDTGCGTGDLKALVEGLTKKPILLANTHADVDHTGANALFDAALIHPAEYANYFAKAPSGAKPAPIWEGDAIDIGGRAFEVVLLPGHTPGSIALLDEANGILLSGDSVSASMIFICGEERSLPAYLQSMYKLRSMRDRFDHILPSHGPFPIDASFIDNVIECGEALQRGELEGRAPMIDALENTLVYEKSGVSFLY